MTDQRGSVRLVVDVVTGDVVQRMDYNELGQITAESGSRIQPFGFAGGLYDPVTKLVHFGARDYDPEIGRWLQKDPLLFGGGDTNLYAYVGGDPINYVDPAGQSDESTNGAIVTFGRDVNMGFTALGTAYSLMSAGMAFMRGDCVGGFMHLIAAAPGGRLLGRGMRWKRRALAPLLHGGIAQVIDLGFFVFGAGKQWGGGPTLPWIWPQAAGATSANNGGATIRCVRPRAGRISRIGVCSPSLTSPVARVASPD